MITFLKGRLVESNPTHITVEIHGVGYELLIPVSSYDRLPPPGESVHIRTHLVVREDAHVLYGFITAEERTLFRQLINAVSGIGPKIALNVLSGMSVADFHQAVAAGDVTALARISGVGKKTAERMVVELKDKLAPKTSALTGIPAVPNHVLQDAIQALAALGLRPPEARDMVAAAARQLGEKARVEDLVRVCLKKK